MYQHVMNLDYIQKIGAWLKMTHQVEPTEHVLSFEAFLF